MLICEVCGIGWGDYCDYCKTCGGKLPPPIEPRDPAQIKDDKEFAEFFGGKCSWAHHIFLLAGWNGKIFHCPNCGKKIFDKKQEIESN